MILSRFLWYVIHKIKDESGSGKADNTRDGGEIAPVKIRLQDQLEARTTKAAMPTPTKEELFVEAFWDAELELGYEVALRVIGERFGYSCDEAEKLLIEDDELNNGNF